MEHKDVIHVISPTHDHSWIKGKYPEISTVFPQTKTKGNSKISTYNSESIVVHVYEKEEK